MTRHHIAFGLVLEMVFCLAEGCARAAGAQGRASLREGGLPGLDGLLSAYEGGDFDVVQRTFARSLDFQNRLRIDKPRELDLWLGSWHRGKALLLLELARVSAKVAPQYVFVIVGAGRRYLA